MPAIETSAVLASRRTFTRLLGLGAAWSAVAPAFAAPESTAAPEAPDGPVRIDSNENPYGPPPGALDALREELPRVCRYPDEAIARLQDRLATELGVAAKQIALGAGSSQILHAAAGAFAAGGCAVVADPTFEALARYAEKRDARVVKAPLTADFRHDLPAMAKAAGDAGLIYVCNPNNPTATVTPAGELRALIASVPASVTVLVDEAYHQYAEGAPGYESVMPWIADHPNLVVARTFSKIYGMAGLRLGFGIGSPAAIEKIEAQLPWDSLNALALAAGLAALDGGEHLERSRRLNAELRASTAAALERAGHRVLPSAANFFMVDLGRDVKPVIAALREKGVRVGRKFPALPNHLRVTIGTAAEMDQFLAAFADTVDSRAAA